MFVHVDTKHYIARLCPFSALVVQAAFGGDLEQFFPRREFSVKKKG